MKVRIIAAKFSSKCAETGKKIKKGDKILYNYDTKKAYSMESGAAQKLVGPADPDLAKFVQANEDAYFDNFCQRNNI